MVQMGWSPDRRQRSNALRGRHPAATSTTSPALVAGVESSAELRFQLRVGNQARFPGAQLLQGDGECPGCLFIDPGFKSGKPVNSGVRRGRKCAEQPTSSAEA
jgi:hypothetical protein